MGAEVLNPDLFRAALDDRPDRPVAQGQLAQLSGLRDRPKQRPIGDAGGLSPAVDALLDPERHGNGTDAPSLPHQVDDRRPALALDDLLELQLGELLAAQPAADQERQQGVVAFADQLLLVRHGEEFLGLVAVEPVPHPGSLLADIGDIGDRGRGLGIEDPIAPGLCDQLADRRELDIDGRGGETAFEKLRSISEQAGSGERFPDQSQELSQFVEGAGVVALRVRGGDAGQHHLAQPVECRRRWGRDTGTRAVSVMRRAAAVRWLPGGAPARARGAAPAHRGRGPRSARRRHGRPGRG